MSLSAVTHCAILDNLHYCKEDKIKETSQWFEKHGCKNIIFNSKQLVFSFKDSVHWEKYTAINCLIACLLHQG